MPLAVEDVVAIGQLVARYNHAIDSGDADGFADTFLADGVLEVPGLMEVSGRAGLGDFVAGLAGLRSPRHVATNLLIEGEGDEATLRAYVQLNVLVDEPPHQVVSWSGVYEDQVVRHGGAWRFRRRVCIADT